MRRPPTDVFWFKGHVISYENLSENPSTLITRYVYAERRPFHTTIKSLPLIFTYKFWELSMCGNAKWLTSACRNVCVPLISFLSTFYDIKIISKTTNRLSSYLKYKDSFVIPSVFMNTCLHTIGLHKILSTVVSWYGKPRIFKRNTDYVLSAYTLYTWPLVMLMIMITGDYVLDVNDCDSWWLW